MNIFLPTSKNYPNSQNRNVKVLFKCAWTHTESVPISYLFMDWKITMQTNIYRTVCCFSKNLEKEMQPLNTKERKKNEIKRKLYIHRPIQNCYSFLVVLSLYRNANNLVYAIIVNVLLPRISIYNNLVPPLSSSKKVICLMLLNVRIDGNTSDVNTLRRTTSRFQHWCCELRLWILRRNRRNFG